jgi:hypothetical protein
MTELGRDMDCYSDDGEIACKAECAESSCKPQNKTAQSALKLLNVNDEDPSAMRASYCEPYLSCDIEVSCPQQVSRGIK